MGTPVLSSLTLSAPLVAAGYSVSGTVTLDEPAPVGGVAVSLASNNAIATVPSFVVIPEGALSTTFPVTTGLQYSFLVVTISASYGNTVSATLFVGASPTLGLILLYPRATDGGTTTIGSVSLAGNPPFPGATVALSSSNPGLAAVPPTVTLPYGIITGQFSITTTPVSTPTAVTITGTDSFGISRSADLIVLPPSNAVFDPTVGTPRCASVSSFCDTGPSLVAGRGSDPGGPEMHAPNTVLASGCSDGWDPAFTVSEFLDRVRIWSLDGNPLAPGRLVQIDAYVRTAGYNVLDLYFAPDASNPSWTPIPVLPNNLAAPTNIFSSAPFRLPPGPMPVVRASWRSRLGAPAAPCTAGTFDDRDDVVFAVGDPVNQAPLADAGPDQTITLPASATLAGIATDDGLPIPPGALITTWSLVSGPGPVTFGSASSTQTNATFTTEGSYVLRLTASDGILSASDDITVIVNPTPINQPPVVDAGPNQTATLHAATSLVGSVSDDGLPNPPATVTVTWSRVSGPPVVFGDAHAAITSATFAGAGKAVLRLTATDGVLESSDTVVIMVRPQTPNAPLNVNAGPDRTTRSHRP